MVGVIFSMTVSLSRPSTERAVLSTILNNMSSGWFHHVVRVAGKQPVELFVDTHNKALFQCIDDVYATNPHPSVAAVVDRAREKHSGVFDNPEEFITTIQLTPAMTTVEQITSTVEDLATLRETRHQVQKMEQLISDIHDTDVEPTPNDVSTRLQDIIDSTEVSADTQTFSDVATEVLNSPRPMWSIKTGITVIDDALGGRGLESGCFTIAAARPKVGKTILMNHLVHQVLDSGGFPLVLNLETKKIEFFSKMSARHIADENIGWGDIKGYITKEELDRPLTATQVEKIEDSFTWAKDQDWYVSFDKNMTQHDIHALVMKAKATYPHDAKIVLFVDYIQLQVQNSMREREEIAGLSRFYKKLAGMMDISVFALAQLNRDAGDSEPKVHQLRGSGALEQDADTIILLDRPGNRDENIPHYCLTIDAGTSRLAEGGKEMCFIDGSTQIVTDLTDDLRMDLGLPSDDGDLDMLGESLL